jgi:hypothetical protein
VKQTLHIFRKDVRKLWPHALVVAGLFALCALSPLNSGVVGLACWTITALLIHEDSPAEESPFWITRPYSRMSLLTAKTLFLFAFVFLPLLASDIWLEARGGVDVLRNTGHLLAFDLTASVGLILLAMAIGTITNNLKSVVGAIVAILFCSFAGTRLTHEYLPFATNAPNILAWAPTVLAAFCIIGIQYAARKTQWNRAALAAAIIASAFMMPRPSVALASNRILNPPGFDLSQIRIAFDESTPPHYEANPDVIKEPCPSVALKVQDLPAGIELRASRGPTVFITSSMGGTRVIPNTVLQEAPDGYREYMCIPGPFTSSPETLQTSLDLEVVAVADIATIPAHPGAFSAGKYGRCEILTPFPENTQLRCDLEEPLTGAITATLEYPGYSVGARSLVRGSGPFQLSPVSHEKFDGSSFIAPRGWPFEEAFARPDAHFVLREERIVGTIRRSLVYPNFPLPWNNK